MYYTLCVVYRDPDGPRKEKDSYEPYKLFMGEHERGWFIIYHYQHKGDPASINRGIC